MEPLLSGEQMGTVAPYGGRGIRARHQHLYTRTSMRGVFDWCIHVNAIRFWQSSTTWDQKANETRRSRLGFNSYFWGARPHDSQRTRDEPNFRMFMDAFGGQHLEIGRQVMTGLTTVQLLPERAWIDVKPKALSRAP